MLAGLQRKKNPKSAFLGVPKDVLKIIWRLVVSHYRAHIAKGQIFVTPLDRCRIEIADDTKFFDVNMLPFYLGEKLDDTLPLHLHCWKPLIKTCTNNLAYKGEGKMAYLTVQRSFVKAGNSQRRSGIHIDAPIINSKQGVNDTVRSRLSFLSRRLSVAKRVTYT